MLISNSYRCFPEHIAEWLIIFENKKQNKKKLKKKNAQLYVLFTLH